MADKLNSEQVVDAVLSNLRKEFSELLLSQFEDKELFLTHLPEFDRSQRQKFCCSGFTYQNENKDVEVIAKAKKLIEDDVGVNLGLRWSRCSKISEVSREELEQCLCYQNERRWSIAQPQRDKLLVGGRGVPEKFLSNQSEGGERSYREEIVTYLTIKVLANRIKKY